MFFIKSVFFKIYSVCCFLFLCLGNFYAQSVGGTTAGAATYCTTTNAGVVTLSGQVGTILNWQSTTNGGVTWNNIVNATPNQTYFNLNQTTCYRAIVQDGLAPSDTSTEVCITVYPESVGGTVTGGGNFCDSASAGVLNLSGYSGAVINWLSSINNGVSWSTISNTSTTENYPTLTQNILYVAVVQSNPSCSSDTSLPATFVISQSTVTGLVIGDSFACELGNSGVLSLTGYIGSILGWESSIDGGNSWQTIVNTSDSLVYTNLTQSIMYRVVVKSGVCDADTSANFTISISPESVGGTLSGGGVFCGTSATGVLSLSGAVGTIVNWISSTNNGVSWNNIVNSTTSENYTNIAVPTLYAVVVQSGSCDVDTSSVEIVDVAPQTIAGTIQGSQTACYLVNSDTLSLVGNIGNVINWISSVNNGTTWNAITNTTVEHSYSGLTQTTMYAAIVQSGSCNVDTSVALSVEVVALPTVNAGVDISINQGESISLNASGQGIALWTPSLGLSNATIFNPSASPATTTSYVLSVTDANGCVNTDSIIIMVIQQSFNGSVSNLFTPNDDGINDVWYLEGIENFSDNEVVVYNAYGNEVYRAQPYLNDWKGTYNNSPLPDATYYYVITFSNSTVVLRGSLDILRSK
ncbi:MAG: gliding motility-associated C-terminal domain-containing protein [Bacteroidia bacterium]